MTDFQKLDRISQRNGHIKAFPLPGNMVSGNTGKNGWGKVTVAVDNASIGDLFSEKVVGILYIVGQEDWKKEAHHD